MSNLTPCNNPNSEESLSEDKLFQLDPSEWIKLNNLVIKNNIEAWDVLIDITCCLKKSINININDIRAKSWQIISEHKQQAQPRIWKKYELNFYRLIQTYDCDLSKSLKAFKKAFDTYGKKTCDKCLEHNDSCTQCQAKSFSGSFNTYIACTYKWLSYKSKVISLDNESIETREEWIPPSIKDKKQEIQELTRYLPSKHREVVRKYCFDQKSHKQIAKELDITEGACKKRYFDALQKMKQKQTQYKIALEIEKYVLAKTSKSQMAQNFAKLCWDFNFCDGYIPKISEIVEQIFSSILMLPKQNQNFINLYFQGYNFNEIASHMNISPSNARKLKHKIKIQLIATVKNYREGEKS